MYVEVELDWQHSSLMTSRGEELLGLREDQAFTPQVRWPDSA
jgi:hypothetical protein